MYQLVNAHAPSLGYTVLHWLADLSASTSCLNAGSLSKSHRGVDKHFFLVSRYYSVWIRAQTNYCDSFKNSRWHYNPFQGYITIAHITRDVLAFFFYNVVLSILRVIYNGVKVVFRTLKKLLVKFWSAIASLGRFVITKVTALFNANRGFLRKATIFTHKFGAVGDLTLIPISLLWMCWPLIVPYFLQVKTWVPWVPAAFFSLLLMRRGYSVVKDTYNEINNRKN